MMERYSFLMVLRDPGFQIENVVLASKHGKNLEAKVVPLDVNVVVIVIDTNGGHKDAVTLWCEVGDVATSKNVPHFKTELTKGNIIPYGLASKETWEKLDVYNVSKTIGGK